MPSAMANGPVNAGEGGGHTPQNTKVERPHDKPAPTRASPRAELDDAITWLSQHLGYPAPSRQAYESRSRQGRR